MPPVLRPHQQQQLEGLRAALRAGHRAVIVQGPTGSGKGTLLAHIAAAACRQAPVVIVSHLGEINRDLVARVLAAGAPSVRYLAEGVEETHPETAGSTPPPVTVCSIQTLSARSLHFPDARLFLWDEAHRAAAETYDDARAAHPEARHVGFTATPARGDGRPLVGYTAIVQGPQVAELVDGGLLAPLTVLAPTSRAEALSADPVEVYPAGRPGVVFASSVEHSQTIASGLLARGLRAAHVDGTTSRVERIAALWDFGRGELDILVNANLFAEGVDLPRAEVCVLARRMSSPVAFLQTTGRVRRPAPAKRSLLIDLYGACHQHGLPDEDRTYHLDGEAIRVARAAGSGPTQCRGCLAWGLPRSICAECGFERPAPPPPRVLARDLVEHRQLEGDASKYRALCRFVARAVELGRKPASAIYIWKGTFGALPPRGWLDAAIRGDQQPPSLQQGAA